MFVFAVSIGVLSYIVFFLGLLRYLYPLTLQLLGIFYVSFIVFYFSSRVRKDSTSFIQSFRNDTILSKLIVGLLFLIIIVNFIGALAPELAFDALWYHLTIPKLYLMEHAVNYIPGGLLYYSLMPKLTEMLYTIALSFGSEIIAKLLHFSFGVLSLIILYNFSRRFFSKQTSLLVALICASNLVFMWESTTAYIDLARTFFELLALQEFISWVKTKHNKYLYRSACMIGFAVTVKLLALGSAIVFISLLFIRSSTSLQLFRFLRQSFLYTTIVLFIPLPWFVFSFVYTGNPVFPFFSIYDTSLNAALLLPLTFLSDAIKIFLFADDPVSPIYLISLPLILFFYRKFSSGIKSIAWYSLLSFFIWYVTPRTGGGRFILPYLPAFSILVGAVIEQSKKDQFLYKSLITCVIVVSVVSTLYRGAATKKYVPVILASENKQHFLSTHLNYAYGDFYDTDGYFVRTITPDDTVLLIGFHNLYYANFPFIHNTWRRAGDTFNYIATQKAQLPMEYKDWSLVHENKTTGVKIYTRKYEEKNSK